MTRWLQGGMEAVVLALVAFSPWAFGAAHPLFERFLYAGVALLLVLWAVRLLLAQRLTWKKCPVALCLAGLMLLGAWQLLPWSASTLAWLSPATLQLHQELAPAQPESLVGGEILPAAAPPASYSLSLYPGATRDELLRILGVLLLFLAVRNNVTSLGSLHRLAIVAVANATLLALVGLLQFFSSPPNVVYWTFASEGSAFGPFICRNHFPFYVNICIGLGLGLLLMQRRRFLYADGPHASGAAPRFAFSPRALLDDPLSVTVVACLALALSSIVVCVSRGGVMALLGGACVCLLVKLISSPRSWRLDAAWLSVALAALLLAWFEFDLLESRLATLWSGAVFEQGDGRFEHWRVAWPLFREFPGWGVGYGLYPYVEPLHRSSAVSAELFVDYAHNDYVQILVEGGLAGLALILAAVGLVFWLGYAGYRRLAGRASGALVLGALFGFATLVLHSFVDFGLHVPANAVLAAVLAAHLCASASFPLRENARDPAPRNRSHVNPSQGNRASADEATESNAFQLRLGGLAPVLGAASLAALAWALIAPSSANDKAERLRVAAERAAAAGDRGAQIARLGAAIAYAPDDALLRLALAEAYATALDATNNKHASSNASDDNFARALEAHLEVRRLCPLAPEPHVWLAAHAHRLAEGDPPLRYLERAQLLRPFDAEIWYARGLHELARKNYPQAWAAWRRSLEISPRRLEEILAKSRPKLSPPQFTAQVLPEDPKVILAAARLVQNEGASSDSGERAFYKCRALSLLTRSGPRRAEDYHLQATLQQELGQPAEAAQSYAEALALAPARLEWRCEYAQLLSQQEEPTLARRQLQAVLAQEPQHRQAISLLETLARAEAERQAQEAMLRRN